MLSKGKGLTFLLIFILVIALFGSFKFISKISGFTFKLPHLQQIVNQTKEGPLPYPSPVIDKTIKFDVEKARIGDKIGNMVITRFSGRKSETPSANDALVNFTGKVTITGEYYHMQDMAIGENICMENLDEESQAKMPKMISDTRVLWFCFSDLEFAKKILIGKAGERGTATVVIDDYTIVYFPSTVFNGADLISVISKK